MPRSYVIEELFTNLLINLQENFENRGYPNETTNEQIIKARN